jgi:hypothetical protein
MNFKIVIPLTQLQPDSVFQRDLVTLIPSMVKNYGNYFRQAANFTNLPVQVLYAIAMVESGGRQIDSKGNVIITGAEGSTGIMQISPNMFYEVYMKEIRGNRISAELESKVKQFLNIDFRSKSTPSPATSLLKQKVATALKNVEFNIIASAIVLRRLLEESSDADMTMRLDKAIIKYNAGLYSKSTQTQQYKTGDTTAVISIAPSITKVYIPKVVGKNGAMYYLLKNKIS